MALFGGRKPKEPALDSVLVDFFLDGDTGPAAAALKARGQRRLFLFQEAELLPLWREYRDAVLAEAARRGVRRPWGLSLDTWKPREPEPVEGDEGP
jgi:hypothetical protein